MSAGVPTCETCGKVILNPTDHLMGWDGQRPIYLCDDHMQMYGGSGFSICVSCHRRVSNNKIRMAEEGAYCLKCWRKRGGG